MTERQRLTVAVAAAEARLQTWNDMVASSCQHWQKCYREKNHAEQTLNALTAGLAALPPDEPKPAPKPCPREVGRRYKIKGKTTGKWAECILSCDEYGKARLIVTDPGGASFGAGCTVAPAAAATGQITNEAWQIITGGCECEALDA